MFTLSCSCVTLAVAVPHHVFWSSVLESLSIILITLCFLAQRAVKVCYCNWTGSLEHDDVPDSVYRMVTAVLCLNLCLLCVEWWPSVQLH